MKWIQFKTTYGRKCVIYHSSYFFWNLRGCSLVQFRTGTQSVQAVPPRYVVTGLGWVAVSITLMFSCWLSWNPVWPLTISLQKNKSMQMGWSNNSIGTHQLNFWNVVLHHLFKAISWSSQGTCMLLVKLYYCFVEYVYNLPFLLLYSSDVWLSIKV